MKLFLVFITINILFGMSTVCAQNQQVADSLKNVLEQEKDLPDSVTLTILYRIAAKDTDPDEIIYYGELLQEKANAVGATEFSARAPALQGVAYRIKGNIKAALEKLFEGLAIAVENDLFRVQEDLYLEIANTYTANGDPVNALQFEKKALKTIRVHSSKEQLALGGLNLGYSYYQLGYLDSAAMLYDEVAPIFEEIKMDIGIAYTLGNRALVYWKQNNLNRAVTDLKAAIAMLETFEDLYGMTDYHNKLSEIYLQLENNRDAVYHAEKAYEMSLQQGLTEQSRDASLLLSKLYQQQGDFEQALQMQSDYILYKDSIQNNELTKKIADIRTEFEVGLKEKEIVLLEERQTRKNIYIAAVFVLLAFSIVLMLYFRQRFRNTKLVAHNQKLAHDDQVKSLMTQQETRALQSMVEGRDQERKRLAKELHNHFGSLLATIKVNVNGIEEEAIPNHDVLTTLIDQACTDMRNISHSLNMGISDDFGLIPALKELISHLYEGNSIVADFDATLSDCTLSLEDEIIVYRMIQELISNVLKHAHADKLTVSLTCYAHEEVLNIIVEDNGQGIKPDKDSSASDGIGISSMKEIINNRDGEIYFDSHPGKGTTVSIDLPITPLN